MTESTAHVVLGGTSRDADDLAARVRSDFPSLRDGEIYLDSAASSLTPTTVLDATARFYTDCRANVQRGSHRASQEATQQYEAAQANLAAFFGARPEDLVFTMNATNALNLVALSLDFGPGDELIVPTLEHVSNMMPWVRVAKRSGARIRWWNPNKDGVLEVAALDELLNENTRLVSVAHVSNVVGTVAPVEEIADRCARCNVVFVLDACQSAPHMTVDASQIGCDFMVASAHKMLGPTGAGLLYVSPQRAAQTEPAIIGSESVDNSTCPGMSACAAGQMPKLQWATAGTPPIAQVLGWSAAAEYLKRLGFDAIERHDQRLVGRLLQRLAANPHVALFGPSSPEAQVGIVAFNVKEVPSEEVGRILSENYGIGVRAGTHCARGYFMENQPEIEVMGNVRASFYLYNTEAEADRLADAVDEISEQLAG